LYGGGRVQVGGLSGTYGYTPAHMTGGGSATWGSWVEVIASVDFDVKDLMVGVVGFSYQQVLGVGVGASGSEVMVAEYTMGRNVLDDTFIMPVIIPAGSRISVRVYNDTAASFDVWVMAHENRTVNASLLLKQAISVTYYSRGVSVDSGATLNTYGAWTEIQDVTDRDISSFMLSATTDESSNGTPRHFLFDVSLGSSGNEADNIIVSGMLLWTTNWGHCDENINYVGVPIAEGSRVSVRMKSDNNVSPRREVSFALTGVTI